MQQLRDAATKSRKTAKKDMKHQKMAVENITKRNIMRTANMTM